MYLDILPNDNLEEACMATFSERGEKKAITKIRLWRKQEWQWCAVIGWNDDEACPAHIVNIEESGDGEAMLVVGGNHGLRFSQLADADAAVPEWDLDDDSQWAEGFLICTMDIEVRS